MNNNEQQRTTMNNNNYRYLYSIIICVIAFEFLFVSNGFGQTVFTDSLMNGNNYQKAAFSLWFKSDIKKLQGIIVLVPGSNYDGRDMVNDTAWQNILQTIHTITWI
jgi:hypothetical protein